MAGDAPTKGLLITRARELVAFAQRQGYRPDEVIQIIESFQ